MLSRWSALLLLFLLANSGCGTGPVTLSAQAEAKAKRHQRYKADISRKAHLKVVMAHGEKSQAAGRPPVIQGKEPGEVRLEPGLVSSSSLRPLSIRDRTNSVVVDCRLDRTLSLLLTYQGTKLSLSGRRIVFQFDNGPEYNSTGMKLRHEKTKKFVEDMVSHRTLALWVPGDAANRAKFDLRPVRQDLQSLVNRCKVPVHDPEGMPRRVTIASRRANIRTRADVKSDVLGQATAGLSFPVVSEEGEWLKINYADKTGWVHLAVTERGKERNVKHLQFSVDTSVTTASRKPNDVVASKVANTVGPSDTANPDEPVSETRSGNPTSRRTRKVKTRAGPFGLSMGMKKSDIRSELVEFERYQFKTSSLPKTHPAFNIYVLQITPKRGLCYIKAVGKTLQTNRYGGSLLLKFNQMEAKLDSAYGSHERIDRLNSGSIWNEAEDWMMALKKRERYLFTTWTLDGDLAKIGLIATALTTESGYLAVEYYFRSHDDCDAERDSVEDSVL